MGFLSKLFEDPETDMKKSRANAQKMCRLFNQAAQTMRQFPRLRISGLIPPSGNPECLPKQVPRGCLYHFSGQKSYISIQACDWPQNEAGTISRR